MRQRRQDKMLLPVIVRRRDMSRLVMDHSMIFLCGALLIQALSAWSATTGAPTGGAGTFGVEEIKGVEISPDVKIGFEGLPPFVPYVRESSPTDTNAPTLSLSPQWNFLLTKGVQSVQRDLMKLLFHFGRPRKELKPTERPEIWNGVYYLMPLKEAVETLVRNGVRMKIQIPNHRRVNCPGLPSDSFFFVTLSTFYKGTIILVVDKKDQVVAVELVNGGGIGTYVSGGGIGIYYCSDVEFERKWGAIKHWSIFDIIRNRRKTKPYNGISHTVTVAGDEKKMSGGRLVVIQSSFIDVHTEPVLGSSPRKEAADEGADINLSLYHKIGYHIIQETTLYLPQDIVNLILYRIMIND